MPGRSVAVRLTAEVSGYIANMTRAGAATQRAMGSAEAATARASKASSRHDRVLSALGTTAKYSGIAVAGGLALAVKEAADFNEKMALVQTLSHANARQMRELSASAMHTGTAFGFTATEVADGQAEMIKAGVSLRDIMGGGLRGTLALAAAGQTDVGTATSIAASALTQFNLRGKDVPHVADLLAAGADKALGSVEDLGYGLGQVGTTAHQMGIGIDGAVGTLAEFAQAGLTGERGGTTFKQMLLQLASPTKQAQVLMDKYHLSLYDANGQMKTMPELAGNIQRSFKDLDPAARNAALGVIFGSRAIQGANILLKDGEAGNRKWIRSVNDQGFAAQQAGGKLDSLKGDMQKLKAEGVNALIELGQGSQSPLRHLVQDVTGGIRKITEDGSLKRWGDETGQVLQTVVSGAKPVVGAIGGIVSAFNSLPSPVKTGLVAGGLGALTLSKVPGGKAVTRGVGSSVSGALGGRGGVVPVFVTNMGKGMGTDSKGDPIEKAGSKLLPAAGANPYAAIAAAILAASYAGEKYNNYGKNPFTNPQTGPLSGGRLGINARHANLGLPDLSLPKGGFGHFQATSGNLGKSLKDLGHIFSALSAGHPWAAFEKTDKAVKGFDGSVKGTHLVLDTFAKGLKRAGVSSEVLDKTLRGKSTTQFAYDLHRAGVSTQQFGQMLHTLPDYVQTKILTPGALESKGAIRALARQFDLTPKQIQTIIKLIGAKKAAEDVDNTRKHVKGLGATDAKPHVIPQGTEDTDNKVNKNKKNLHTLNATTAKPHVDLQGAGSAAGQISHVSSLLAGLDGDHATTTITTIHANTQKNTILNYYKNLGHPKAGGGHITGPGTETSDSIPAMLSDNEYVVRAAAVRKYGVGMFDQINAMHFANGGLTRARKFAGGGSVGDGLDDLHYRHNIRGVTRELAKLTAELKKTRESRKEYSKTVAQAYVTDPFQGTLGGFDSQVAYETKRIRGARADLKTLRNHGLGGALYKELAASGNATLIDQFSHLTRAQIAARERSYRGLNRADKGLGDQAATQVFSDRAHKLGDQIDALRREVHALRHGHHIGNTNIRHATIRDSDTKTKTKAAARKARHNR